MPSPNGLAMRPIMRFSVVPKSIPFEIERPDPSGDPTQPPTVVTLRAWHRHGVHPAHVDIAVEAARDVYREWVYRATQEREAAPGAVQNAPAEQAWVTWNADTLCAVIEDLDPNEAMMLARPDGPWEQILVALGWREATAEQPTEAEGDDPEAEAGEAPATTTDASGPSSLTATASIAGES